MKARLPHVRIGANPIIWSNDDFQELGGDIPLERCLQEMRHAGYEGTELGHKYPRQQSELQPLLEQFDLQLVSGWHSLQLLEQPLATEQQRLLKHVEFLRSLGSRVVIVAECSRRLYNIPGEPLQFDGRESAMDDSEWQRLCAGLETLSSLAADHEMSLVYHHHVGTVVQDRAEIDRLMQSTSSLRLLVDTGHLAFAGVEPLAVLRDYADRVGHVHLKDVRQEVVQEILVSGGSFDDAVRRGVFTVPGDGDLDFKPLFAQLETMRYAGWLVVEAEQDPDLSPPMLYAARGREYLRRSLGV